MVVEEIRRLATSLGLKHAERMDKGELIRAIQAAEGKRPCFDQQSCRPSLHHRCHWKRDCGARLEPAHGLILTDNVVVGHQIVTLLSSSYGWKMKLVHTDRQAYALMQQGNIDVVVSDIDAAGLGGLAVLSYARHHWPSIMAYGITRNEDMFLKKLARDLGGCLGFFRRVKGTIELDIHTDMDIHPTYQPSPENPADISRVSIPG
jgi:CheY-like chemotaxis protein